VPEDRVSDSCVAEVDASAVLVDATAIEGDGTSVPCRGGRDRDEQATSVMTMKRATAISRTINITRALREANFFISLTPSVCPEDYLVRVHFIEKVFIQAVVYRSLA
jgi:hypothetical protein